MKQMPIHRRDWADHVWTEALDHYARQCFQGHFTIFRFTSNVRVMVGTPANRSDIDAAHEGVTICDAVKSLLWKQVQSQTTTEEEKRIAKAYLEWAIARVARHAENCAD